jgi:hypothetical protein
MKGFFDINTETIPLAAFYWLAAGYAACRCEDLRR